jgi:hypothetical protein
MKLKTKIKIKGHGYAPQKIIAYKYRWRIKYSQPYVIKSDALSKLQD